MSAPKRSTPSRRRSGRGRGANGSGGNGHPPGPVLVTGGAGFIGTNLAARLAEQGESVLVLDNLSRKGVEENLRWLVQNHPGQVEVETADVRDAAALRRAVARASAVYHFAAQVAVTTSLEGPREDFEINARGTLNVLEALRALQHPPQLVYTSTNKVYGKLGEIDYTEQTRRYVPSEPALRAHGVSERQALDFYSPYGCSKGTADQYVLDYARVFGLATTVFRMSCIYGPHQFGTEDQGWVAHFALRALAGEPITIYGDGKQVRDVLWAEDLVDALLLARDHEAQVRGRAFNIGGGPDNTVSLLEVLDLLGELGSSAPTVSFDRWRPGDQLYYVSDTRAFTRATGWRPRIGAEEGVRRLHRWLTRHRMARPAMPRQAPGAPVQQVS